jgi:hypothetical protein
MTNRTIEEQNLEQMLRQLITDRVEHRRTPSKSTHDEMQWELDYARSWRYISGYIDRARTRTDGPHDISPARQAQARSILAHKRPLSKTGSLLAELTGADEILKPRDGEVWEEIESGRRWRTHVSWVPVDPEAFFDEENEQWIETPTLKGSTS